METKFYKEDTDALYSELFTPLFRYAYFRTKNYDIACDLTQSSFLKFMLQENRPKTKEHSKRLLYTIARTLLIDHYRTNSKKHTESIDEGEFDIPSDSPNPTQIFETNENVELVKNVLKNLNEREAEIVTLRISGDITFEEIAKIVNVSGDNARQIYKRSLQKIGKLLEGVKITFKN